MSSKKLKNPMGRVKADGKPFILLLARSKLLKPMEGFP